MIDKKIHYCWFGGKELPNNLKKCIESWKRILPDYEIVRWDETNFDVNSTVWTREAYQMKKYAFVSDYVRLKALYEFGGIYLDTDVMVKKSLDVFLKHKAFMGFENETYLTSSIIGCEKKFPMIGEFLSYYDNRKFINEDNSINNKPNVIMMTEICKKHGLLIEDKIQKIDEMHIYPRTYFCPYDFYMNSYFSEETHTIHYFEASWLDEKSKNEMKLSRNLFYKKLNVFLLKISKIIKK